MSRNKILNEAKQMFLKKGFKNTSMRVLAANVELTTGAIYGYFKNKNDIFENIVGVEAKLIYQTYENLQKDFEKLRIEDKKENLKKFSQKGLVFFIDSFYSNREIWKLLICSSEGTNYANYINKFLNFEIKSTKKYLSELSLLGKDLSEINEKIIQVFVETLYKGIFEIVKQDMSKEDAQKYLSVIFAFYQAGWDSIINK